MEERQLIESAKEYIENLFATDSSGHDAEHSLRVYRTAMRLAESEPSGNRLVIGLSALLHDADDHKLFNTEHNENARCFLEKQQVSKEYIEQIIEVINGVSFSKNRGKAPVTIEGKIVQDADRLDALGAIGIARTFSYGGAHGRSIQDSIQHFEDKLLLLKDEMNTHVGKQLAEARHKYIEEFRKQILEEINP